MVDLVLGEAAESGGGTLDQVEIEIGDAICPRLPALAQDFELVGDGRIVQTRVEAPLHRDVVADPGGEMVADVDECVGGGRARVGV